MARREPEREHGHVVPYVSARNNQNKRTRVMVSPCVDTRAKTRSDERIVLFGRERFLFVCLLGRLYLSVI